MKITLPVIAGLTRNLLVFLLICSVRTAAQAQTADPNLNREMTLEKEYVPSVKDADKINNMPDVSAPSAPKVPLRFANYMSALDVPPSLYPLKSLASAFGANDQLGYVSVGGSTLPDFLAEAGFQILRTPADRLNLYGSVRAGEYKMKHLEVVYSDKKKKNNDNVFGLNYLHHFKTWKIFADAQYTYSQYNNYGQPSYYPSGTIGEVGEEPDFSDSDKIPAWKNNLFAAHIGTASTNLDYLSFKINATYTQFKQTSNNPSSRAQVDNLENRALLNLDLNAPLSFDKRIGVGGYANFNSNSLNNENTAFLTASVTPYIVFEGENWETHLGVNGSLNKQGDNELRFLLAPDVRFHVRPSAPVLFYISAQGGFADNSRHEVFYQNRYLDPYIRVKDSRTLLDAKLGTDFTISNLNVDLHTGYRIIKDEWFWANDMVDLKNVPLYADAKVFNAGGAVHYAKRDVVDIVLAVDYNKWDVTDDWNIFGNQRKITDEAINKPQLVADLKIGFKPAEPLRIDLAYHLEAGRKFPDLNPAYQMAELDDVHDVSLKGTYSLSKYFSVFVAANNLLFQKNEMWYGYPANPFNVMGGISYKF
ncbi:hypothetical protein AGMMS4957_10470 [Bacteroidia bacterium]|nr:hypothetical protein AGMMS4957_10470 [Bacteroidia bacterium]